MPSPWRGCSAVEFADGLAEVDAVVVEDAGVDEAEWVLASHDRVVDAVDLDADRDVREDIETTPHCRRARSSST
jgi:hypothetical protein